ncbi:hypothetical protein SKAU_G00278330 [Synaphobranchus kaupii]|uniref:Uncharacterized protein n=1 Tax=Synaphobranchus kaupii TaxID=118154 RepID=A0A9Q1ILL1_SYNKA|nr:hypothetical protein SKAU_G00278330 [Synaphobranchus kaupii]
MEDEMYKIRAVSQCQQGEVDKLGSSHHRAITLADMWRIPQARLSFLIRSTYDSQVPEIYISDIVLWSTSSRMVIMAELTVPWRKAWRQPSKGRRISTASCRRHGPGRRRHSGVGLRRWSKEASGFGSEGKMQRGASKDVRVSLQGAIGRRPYRCPHHLEMFWDQRGETSVMGGSQLTTLQLAQWHRAEVRQTAMPCR